MTEGFRGVRLSGAAWNEQIIGDRSQSGTAK